MVQRRITVKRARVQPISTRLIRRREDLIRQKNKIIKTVLRANNETKKSMLNYSSRYLPQLLQNG